LDQDICFKRPKIIIGGGWALYASVAKAALPFPELPMFQGISPLPTTADEWCLRRRTMKKKRELRPGSGCAALGAPNLPEPVNGWRKAPERRWLIFL